MGVTALVDEGFYSMQSTSKQKSIWRACFVFYATFIFCFLSAHAEDAVGITPNGHRLTQLLDQTHVEGLWQAGIHVAWETGEPDGKLIRGPGKHTHCSAFVAATAKKLGVYILRPPEHSAKLLANAQYDWLVTNAASKGWIENQDATQAQKFSNLGYLVVAVYRNHHDDKPGHIAIVRPDTKSPHDIEIEGPQIIQAGGKNYLSTALNIGFASHPAAWKKKEVRFFAHEIDWKD